MPLIYNVPLAAPVHYDYIGRFIFFDDLIFYSRPVQNIDGTPNRHNTQITIRTRVQSIEL